MELTAMFLAGMCFGLSIAISLFLVLRREAIRRMRKYRAAQAGATVEEMRERAEEVKRRTFKTGEGA